MKKIILVFFCAVSFMVVAEAQTCSTGARIAGQIWNQTGRWNSPTLMVPFVSQFKVTQNVWNTLAGNSNATWGPRRINVDKRISGTVQGGTKRTFVSSAMFYNDLKINLDKTGGRGRTVVLICTHDDDGNTEGVREYEFPNSALTSSKVFRVPNVRGKIVSVAISCKTGFRSFSYDVKLKNYDRSPVKRR